MRRNIKASITLFKKSCKMFSMFKQPNGAADPSSLASTSSMSHHLDPNDPVNQFRADINDVNRHITRRFNYEKITDKGLPKHDPRELVLISRGIEQQTNVIVSAASISVSNTFPFKILVSVNGLDAPMSTPHGEKQGVFYVDAFKTVPLQLFYNGKSKAEPVLRNRELVQTVIDCNVDPATPGAPKFDVLREETMVNDKVARDDVGSAYQAVGSASTVTPYKLLDANHPFYTIATRHSIDAPGFDPSMIIVKQYNKPVHQKWLTHHYNAVLNWTRENIFEKFNVVDISSNALKVTITRADGGSFSSWDGSSTFANRNILETRSMGISIELVLTYYIRS